jgi:hypothetical protein
LALPAGPDSFQQFLCLFDGGILGNQFSFAGAVAGRVDLSRRSSARPEAKRRRKVSGERGAQSWVQAVPVLDLQALQGINLRAQRVQLSHDPALFKCKAHVVVRGQLPKHSGEYLLEVIMRRYENRSTIMTSNRPLEEWGKLLSDVPTAGAILDRFLHHAQVIAITGKSYRVKEAPVITQENKKSRKSNEPSTAGAAS